MRLILEIYKEEPQQIGGCLYSGYWKVYRNVPLKKKMFEDFEKAKESVIQLLAEDIDMRLILEIYKEEPQQIAV
jgi:hypothetical protein